MSTDAKNKFNLNSVSQVLLPTLTISGFLLTALKKPAIGLILNLIGQIFWVYSGWKAWRNAGQIGIFITVVLTTVVILFGVINYWLF